MSWEMSLGNVPGENVPGGNVSGKCPDATQNNVLLTFPVFLDFSRNRNKPELEKFEKMWNDYSCCIELIVSQLWKTFNLVSRFPIKSSTFGMLCMPMHLSVFTTFPPKKFGLASPIFLTSLR